MPDALGWRMRFGVIAPSTDTIVQPEFDEMRPEGLTNHFGRIHIPNDPLRNDDDFARLIETVRREIRVGTNLAMARLAGIAEPWLGKPVVAINTATYWCALRSDGILDRKPGFGALLHRF